MHSILQGSKIFFCKTNFQVLTFCVYVLSLISHRQPFSEVAVKVTGSVITCFCIFFLSPKRKEKSHLVSERGIKTDKASLLSDDHFNLSSSGPIAVSVSELFWLLMHGSTMDTNSRRGRLAQLSLHLLMQ